MYRNVTVVLTLFSLFGGVHVKSLAAADDPRGVASATDVARLSASRLECLVGNNKSLQSPLGQHRAGYNGIFWLRSPEEPESPFVPAYAGLNLEHYFDSRAEYEGNSFFEPRFAEMSLRRTSATSVELHQPPTPTFRVESWTRFSVADPHYIDFSFRFVVHDQTLSREFMGVFWASYINGPLDKSLYFLDADSTLDNPTWRQLCTQQHNRDSSVRGADDRNALVFERSNASLFSSLSPLRYSEPFFYGRYRNMVLIYIFQPNPQLRLTHSPSGGGPSQSGDDTNPAWDFHLVYPKYQVGQEYRLDGRLVYKRWIDRADVIAEVRNYRAGAAHAVKE